MYVRTHTAPTQISIVCVVRTCVCARARAHVNVHVHGLVYTHAVNVHVYVCATLHNLFFFCSFTVHSILRYARKA